MMSCFKVKDIETGNEDILENIETDFNGGGNEKKCMVDPVFHEDTRSEVILLDISTNREWLAYMTYQKYDDNGTTLYAKNSNNQIRTFLTRRKFDEVVIKQASDDDTLTTDPEEDAHVSIDITHLLKDPGPNHCRFLSISPDGKYVVLSFYERNPKDNAGFWPPQNKGCLIFKVYDNGIFFLHAEMYCDGRAVFIGEDDDYSLVLINTQAVEVYAAFPDITESSHVLDLSQFLLSIQQQEELYTDDLYIQNSLWVDTQSVEDNSDINRIMSLSRHIQHNMIITHFTGGLARLWSLTEDGGLLTAFHAIKENIVAFSEDSTYAATVPSETTRTINIYHIKSGSLVYQLRSQVEEDLDLDFTVSHIDFFYGGKYVSMSAFEGEHVVFEVWYMEAEKSIYRIAKPVVTATLSWQYSKYIQPFVTWTVNEENKKCLKGVYVCFEQSDTPSTYAIELDIDQVNTESRIEWIQGDTLPLIGGGHEIYNNLNDYSRLKCAHFILHETQYLLRFGQHTVQLWKLSENNCTKDKLIAKEDELVYIRAYKGPDYGVFYSFRENWEIHNFDSIKLVDGVCSGRILVNITQSAPDQTRSTYHTEELFLPLSILSNGVPDASTTDSDTLAVQKSFDYHRFESACQALHFLTFYNSSATRNKGNYTMMLSKTENIIHSTMKDLDKQSNFFSTVASSRTLSMLASFKSGRDIIKMLIGIELPILILSYPVRTLVKTNDTVWHKQKKGNYHLLNFFFRNRNTSQQSESNMLTTARNSAISNNGMSFVPIVDYRNSRKETRCTDLSKRNENVLTVLIEENENDLYKLLFNCILQCSKTRSGTGGLLALTDALLFLQKEGNSDLLLESSQKLSFLSIEKEKLNAQKLELNQIERTHYNKTEVKTGGFKVYTLTEQIHKCGKWRQIMRYYTDRVSDLWKTFSKGSKDHTWHSYQVCVLQLPHTSTYDSTVAAHCDFLEGSYQHRNNIYRQSEILHKVLLEYKYQQFIRRRLFYLFAIHIVYYITFSTGVVFSQELNNNIIETKFRVRSPGQMASIGLMCAAAFVLMLQKICQFWTSSRKLSWLCSIYHWIDIAAVILPVFTFVHMINGWSHFSELCSATTLILWIHAIFRIRVIPSFGYIIETVIETARIVRSVVIVMLVVVFMFTNTNMVLIHLKPDEYYQENYNVIYSGVVGSDNSFGHSSGSYGFSNVFRSFSQICYFIYGSWDPANDGAEVESIIFIKVVSILFSVMTLVMLFNLLITIRANRLDDIRKHARGIWVKHFSAVAFELESYCRPKDARTFIQENPTHVYYLATEEDVKNQQEKLDKETKDLLKKLKVGNSTEPPPCACCKKQ